MSAPEGMPGSWLPASPNETFQPIPPETVQLPSGKGPLTSPTFLGFDDAIVLDAYNINTNLATIRANITLLVESEPRFVRTVPMFINPTSNGSQQTFTLTNLNGWILGVNFVSPTLTSGTLHRGECYVSVKIFRGSTSFTQNVNVLVQDYMTSMYFPSWPYGRQSSEREGNGGLVLITPANPAQGAEISVAIPARTIWRLHSFHARLVTASGGSARVPQLQFVDNGKIFRTIPSSVTHASTTTKDYDFIPEYPLNSEPLAGQVCIGIGSTIDLLGGDSGIIQTTTSNIDTANDQWKNIFIYVERFIQQ